MSETQRNDTCTLERKNGNLKVAVNSIQRTLFVERLCVNTAYPADRIIPYDHDNLYPQKIKSIAQRSGTTKGAIRTMASFLAGEGFLGMKTVINREKQTLWDILRFCAESYPTFFGVALHFNFNLLGQITEINPINFDFVRWDKDLFHLIVNPEWGKRNYRRYEVKYKPFNPQNAIKEIQECGGINNYTGQLYYWIPNISDWYTTCYFDEVLDDAQFEAEAKLYSLSSIQNDYSVSGVLSYPKNLTDEDDINNVKEDLKDDTGAAKAGGVRVVGTVPTEGLNNWKWFTPIARNNIDSLHSNQIERAKFNIYAAFRQPPILNGVATGGMFNQESFADAFHYYNSAIESERKDLEGIFNEIIQNSIWANLGNIEIQPKNFIERVKNGGDTTNNA